MYPGIKYGLVAAVAMSAWMLAEFGLGLHTTHIGLGHYTSAGTEVILLLVLWRLLLHLRRQPGRAWLPVWEGLLQGGLTGLVAAMGFYIFLSLYLHFLNPDYADLMLEWQVGHLRSLGTSEEEIRRMARNFRWSMSTTGLPVTVFTVNLVIAIVASPLLTLWLNWRHREPPVQVG